MLAVGQRQILELLLQAGYIFRGDRCFHVTQLSGIERQIIENPTQEFDLADIYGELWRTDGLQAHDRHGDHFGVGFGAIQADQLNP